MTAHRIRLDVTEQQARTLARWCEAARLAWNWGLSERDRQYRDRVGGPAFDRRRGNWIPVGEKWQPDPEAPRENLDRLTTRVRREARPVVDGRAAGPRLPLRIPYAGRGLASVSGRFGGPAGAEEPGDVVRPLQPGRPARRSPGAAAEDRLAAACRAPAVAGSGQDRACQLRGRPVVSGPWSRLGSSAPSGSWRERRSGCRREDIGRSRVGGRSPCAPVRQSAGRTMRCSAVSSVRGVPCRANGRASANCRKAVLRLARVHARIAAVRRDATEQVSTSVARSVRRVGIEDLAVRDMLRSPLMARPVADAAMSRLRSRVGVKVCEAGGQVLVASRFYASTRTCSVCRGRTGRIPAGQAGLGVRRWTCEHCGAAHDRTVNSARNLDPAVWSEQMDAAGRAESQNARGQACQSPVSADGGGLAEAGSALARNPHAGAVSPRRDELVGEGRHARHKASGAGVRAADEHVVGDVDRLDHHKGSGVAIVDSGKTGAPVLSHASTPPGTT